LPGYRPHRDIPRSQLEAIFALIRQSKRPIIYAGGGIVVAGASPWLKLFSEKTGIPVALTVHGLGAFPGEHYLSLNMLGMHGSVCANYAINEADLLLALGVRFDDRVTGKVSEFAKHGKIVHIDVDPSEINKIKAATLPIVGDLGRALRDMVQMIDADANVVPKATHFRDWLQQIDLWREKEPFKYADRADAIVPQYAIDRLWQIVKERGRIQDTIVTTGVGQ